MPSHSYYISNFNLQTIWSTSIVFFLVFSVMGTCWKKFAIYKAFCSHLQLNRGLQLVKTCCLVHTKWIQAGILDRRRHCLHTTCPFPWPWQISTLFKAMTNKFTSGSTNVAMCYFLNKPVVDLDNKTFNICSLFIINSMTLLMHSHFWRRFLR